MSNTNTADQIETPNRAVTSGSEGSTDPGAPVRPRAGIRLIRNGDGSPVRESGENARLLGEGRGVKGKSAQLEMSFFTIGRKITFYLSAVVLVALSIVSFFSYRSVSHDLELMLGQRLEHIARTGTLLVDGDAHQKIFDGFMNGDPDIHKSAAYKSVHEALKKVKINNELESDIYTLIDAGELAPGNMMFIAMAKDEPYTGNAMPLHPKVDYVLKTGKFASTGLYTDHEGTWVSAFAPIITKEGKTVAVMEVDYNAAAEVKEAKMQLIQNLLIPAGLGLFLALVLGNFVGRSLSAPIRYLAEKARLVAKGDLDVKVEAKSKDETGALSGIFAQMVSDLKRQREELKDYATNLEKKVSERTAQLNEANRNIQGMVDSVSQGFFMFDEKGACLPIRSKACLELLGSEPAGAKAAQVLKMQGDAQADFEKWTDLIFEGLMPFDDLAPLGPKQLPTSDGKFVTLEFFPVNDENGSVRRVVAIATDKTAERDAKVRAEQQKEYAAMILKFAKNKKRLQNMITESKTQFMRMQDELEKSKPDVLSVFRLLHTFKSASASFSMGSVAQLAHELESEFIEIRNAAGEGKAVDLAPWKVKLKDLEARFIALIDDNKDVLGSAMSGEGPVVEIPVAQLKRFKQELSLLGTANSWAIAEFSKVFLTEKIENYFNHYNDVVNLVASKQGKEVGELVFEGGDMKIFGEPYQEVFSSMIHAFRNAVDHGVEEPAERMQAGKPPMATIKVKFIAENRDGRDWIKIRVEDDGRGIDPKKIRAKFEKLGKPLPVDESDFDVIQRVFDSGFSTKEEVTDVSGRGVGMDAIKNAAVVIGGNCRVSSQVGKGTVLEVFFPEAAPKSS